MNKAFILQMLKTKYANLGLSEKILGSLADQILAKLEAGSTADQVQEAVDAVEPTAKLLQSAADDARTKYKKDAEEAAKQKGGAGSGNDDPNKEKEKEKESGSGEAVPEWAKALIKSNETLTQELTNMKAGKTKETRLSLYKKELEGIPQNLQEDFLADFESLSFKDDEAFENFVTRKKATFEGLRKDAKIDSYSEMGSNNPNGVSTDKPSPNVAKFIESRKEGAKTAITGKSAFES